MSARDTKSVANICNVRLKKKVRLELQTSGDSTIFRSVKYGENVRKSCIRNMQTAVRKMQTSTCEMQSKIPEMQPKICKMQANGNVELVRDALRGIAKRLESWFSR